MSDYSKKYLANTAWSSYMNRQKENQGGLLNANLIARLIRFPEKQMINKANYNIGKEMLQNSKNLDALKGAYTPEQLLAMKNYKEPEGLLKFVEKFKNMSGYGTANKIGELGKVANQTGTALEYGVTPETIQGVETAGASGLKTSAILALLFGAGYGVGKRGSTFHRLFKGGRKD